MQHDVEGILRKVNGYAWKFADRFRREHHLAKLDADDIESEAGLAVTLAIRDWKPDGGASVLSLACRYVYCALLKLFEANCRRPLTVSWEVLRTAVAPSQDMVVEDPPTPRELAEAGATIRQIRDNCGLSFHQARSIHQRAA